MKTKHRFFVILLIVFAVTGISTWFVRHDAPSMPAPAAPGIASADESEPITPLPLAVSLDARTVELGRRLFHERKLSADGSVSCASCHDLSRGGVDRRVRSVGIGGREGGINAPTVFNSGYSFRQFWDGRAESLEDQVNGPLQHPAEMASNWTLATAALAQDDSYRAEFVAIFRDGITPGNVRTAIATFERSLITPNSRVDRYLRGDRSALSEAEQAGYRLFKRIGCTSCHHGIAVGGNSYQRLGVMEDYFAVRGKLTEADFGRFNITHRDEDRYFFKVPSLRNVALTEPYLHDGSVRTLPEVVEIMARYQLNLKLEPADVDRIVAFLRALTGEYQGRLLE